MQKVDNDDYYNYNTEIQQKRKVKGNLSEA